MKQLKCNPITSDGAWTIGYHDKRPAFWPGNMEQAPDEKDVVFVKDEMTFTVHTESDYLVVNGSWIYQGPEA